MTRVAHGALALANSAGNGTAAGKAKTASIHETLAECAKAICSRKTWAYLVGLIHVDEHVAKHRLSGTRRFSAEDLALMLRSERGLDYLVAVMADAEPAWWSKVKRHIAIAEAASMQREVRRKLKEAINADADVSASIAAATIFQDPEFYQPHADAQRAIRGVSDQSLAQAAKRR